MQNVLGKWEHLRRRGFGNCLADIEDWQRTEKGQKGENFKRYVRGTHPTFSWNDFFTPTQPSPVQGGGRKICAGGGSAVISFIEGAGTSPFAPTHLNERLRTRGEIYWECFS